MKVLVIGKKNHLGWVEHVYNGFRQNGNEAALFYTNKPGISRVFYKLARKNPSIEQFLSKIKVFKPDVAVFVGAFFIETELYELCKRNNIITVGWVGDKFSETHKRYVDVTDFLFVSDSAFIKMAEQLGFKNVELLQFGYDPYLHKQYVRFEDRVKALNFVGSYTSEREKTFSALRNVKFYVYGHRWDKLENISSNWKIYNKKISQKKLVEIYNNTLTTLNVAQKNNIINMVNMRTFEAAACGSCVLNDYVKDLDLCFEDGKEILVYRNLDELKYLSEKIIKDEKFVKDIVNNMSKKLRTGEFTYKNRVKQILKKIKG